jgi:hypothetical protein
VNRSTTDPAHGEVTIRLSTPEDDHTGSVGRLAARTGARPPHGPVMLAEIDGEPVAALALADGKELADCHADRSVLTLLRLRRWEIKLITAVWGA